MGPGAAVFDSGLLDHKDAAMHDAIPFPSIVTLPGRVLTPSGAVSQPQLQNRGQGGLDYSHYRIAGSSLLMTNGTAWHVYDCLQGLITSAWFDDLQQYGVKGLGYAGYDILNDVSPSGIKERNSDGWTLILCTDAEAHRFDQDGFVFGQQWAAYHDSDEIGPFAICPMPEVPNAYNWNRIVFEGALTHEVAELLTDTVPGTGWLFPDNSEADDTVCLWDLVELPGASGELYAVSRYWSNELGACWR